MSVNNGLFCGFKLRPICIFIAYLHLISSVVDIFCHLLTVAIVTNGFQCDVDIDSLRKITNLPFIEPILLILNLGTHGFYPFPRIVRSQYNAFAEFMTIATVPKCYPGMLHVYLVDVLNLFINLIWLKIVIAYVRALHKNEPEPMGMFFSLSIVKLIMQIMYFGYQPPFQGSVDYETYWSLKILDILIAVFLLMLVRKYTKFLKTEITEKTKENPPPYMEYIIGTIEEIPVRKVQPGEDAKKDAVLDVEAGKSSEDKVIEKSHIDTPN